MRHNVPRVSHALRLFVHFIYTFRKAFTCSYWYRRALRTLGE
jgi:hypothetical protein